eukprot:3484401-Rhodomonas_salina.1
MPVLPGPRSEKPPGPAQAVVRLEPERGLQRQPEGQGLGRGGRREGRAAARPASASGGKGPGSLRASEPESCRGSARPT